MPDDLRRYVWTQDVQCGDGRHDVVLVATPWTGVGVEFNPCEALPDVVRKLSHSSCRQTLGFVAENSQLQRMWVDPANPSPSHWPRSLHAVRDYFVQVVTHRTELAASLLPNHDTRSRCDHLRADDPSLQWAAVILCEPDSPAEALPGLLHVAESDHALLRAAALYVLCSYGQPRALDALGENLVDESLHVDLRKTFVRRLGAVGEQRHVQYLVAALGAAPCDDWCDVVGDGLRTLLRHRGGNSHEQMQAVLRTTFAATKSGHRHRVIDTCAPLGDLILAPLHAILAEATPAGDLALDVVTRMGHYDSRYPLLEAWQCFPTRRDDLISGLLGILQRAAGTRDRDVEFLLRLLPFDDPDLRFLAVQQLSGAADQRVVAPLAEILTSELQPLSIRRQAGHSLAATGLCEAATPLLQAASAADRYTSTFAVEALVTLLEKLPASTPRAQLLNRLLASHHEPLLLAALRYSQAAPAEVHWRTLLPLCDHPSARVVDAAARLLHQAAPAESFGPLLDRVLAGTSRHSVYLCAAIRDSVRDLDPRRADHFQSLCRAIQAADQELAVTAVHAVARRRDDHAIKGLFLAAITTNREVIRRTIAREIAAIGLTPDQISQLVRMLADGDDRMARAAADMLTAIGNAAVKPVAKALHWPSPRARVLATQILAARKNDEARNTQ